MLSDANDSSRQSRPRSWRWFARFGMLAMFCACLFALATPAAGQEADPPTGNTGNGQGTDAAGAWQFGFDLFQMLLEQSGLEPTTDVDAALADPQGTVIVLLGRVDDSFPLQRLPQFLEQGSVLIATDQGFRHPWIAEIASGPVQALQPDDRYQGFADCIRVPVAEDDANGESDWLAGVSELVANRAGWIRVLSPVLGRWHVDARLPRLMHPASSAGGPLIASLTPHGARVPHLILASDHSLFSNGMMWHGDNAVAAIKMAQILRRPGHARVLFLADGQPRPSYLEGPVRQEIPPPVVPPIESVPELEAEQMLKVANTVITKAEDADLFNELLANQPRQISAVRYRRMLLFGALLVMIALAIYGLSPRASTAAAPSPYRRPMAPAYVLGLTKGIAIDRRGVVAQTVARDFLIEWTGSSSADQWRRQVVEHTRGIAGKREREKLLSVLALAENPRVPILSSSKLKEVGRTLDELRKILSTRSSETPRLSGDSRT